MQHFDRKNERHCVTVCAWLSADVCAGHSQSLPGEQSQHHDHGGVGNEVSQGLCTHCPPPTPRKNSTWWLSWPATLRQKKLAKACRVNNLSITIMAVSGTKSHKVCAPTGPPPPRKNSTWWLSWRAILRQKKPARNIAHSACPSVCTVCIVPRPRGRQCQTTF